MADREKRLREQAAKAFSSAVRRGILVRQPCEHCGLAADQGETIQGHHFMGYTKEHWLTVLWLCRRCHGWLHGNGSLPRLHPYSPAERKLLEAMRESIQLAALEVA